MMTASRCGEKLGIGHMVWRRISYQSLVHPNDASHSVTIFGSMRSSHGRRGGNASANNGRVWQRIPGGWVADDGEEEEKEEDAAYTDLLDHPWSFPYSKGYPNNRWRGSPFAIGMDGVDESVVCLRSVYLTILHTWMCPFDYSMSVTHFTGRTVSY